MKNANSLLPQPCGSCYKIYQRTDVLQSVSNNHLLTTCLIFVFVTLVRVSVKMRFNIFSAVTAILFSSLASAQLSGKVGPTTSTASKAAKKVCNILNYGGVASKNTDNGPAIASAWAACKSGGEGKSTTQMLLRCLTGFSLYPCGRLWNGNLGDAYRRNRSFYKLRWDHLPHWVGIDEISRTAYTDC